MQCLEATCIIKCCSCKILPVLTFLTCSQTKNVDRFRRAAEHGVKTESTFYAPLTRPAERGMLSHSWPSALFRAAVLYRIDIDVHSRAYNPLFPYSILEAEPVPRAVRSSCRALMGWYILAFARYIIANRDRHCAGYPTVLMSELTYQPLCAIYSWTHTIRSAVRLPPASLALLRVRSGGTFHPRPTIPSTSPWCAVRYPLAMSLRFPGAAQLPRGSLFGFVVLVYS